MMGGGTDNSGTVTFITGEDETKVSHDGTSTLYSLYSGYCPEGYSAAFTVNNETVYTYYYYPKGDVTVNVTLSPIEYTVYLTDFITYYNYCNETDITDTLPDSEEFDGWEISGRNIKLICTYDEEYSIPSVGTSYTSSGKTQYFHGWMKEDDTSETLISSIKNLAVRSGSVYMESVFKENEPGKIAVKFYTYVSTGYSVYYSIPVTVQVDGNGSIDSSAIPEVTLSDDGYEFDYWYLKDDETKTAVDFDTYTASDGDAFEFAYKGKTYSITYVLASGYDLNSPDTVILPSQTTYTYKGSDSSYTLAAPTFKNNANYTGYNFNGWISEDPATYEYVKYVSAYTIYSSTKGDITVYGRWSPWTVTFTLHSNYDTDTTSTKTVTYPDSSVPANSFERSGYSFTKWNTSSDGSGDSYMDGGKFLWYSEENEDGIKSGDLIELYAQWGETNFTVKVSLPEADDTDLSLTLDSDTNCLSAVLIGANEFTWIIDGTESSDKESQFSLYKLDAGTHTVQCKATVNGMTYSQTLIVKITKN